MTPFDPFGDGSASEVMGGTKPEVASGPATDPTFDPFATGRATAHEPDLNAADPSAETSHAPDVGTDWNMLFRGVDKSEKYGYSIIYPPKVAAAFEKLDQVSDNSEVARKEAINQAYIGATVKGLSHATIERNWPAVRDAYANTVLGLPGKDITDTQLYSAIAKQRFNEAVAMGDDTPEAKAALQIWKSPDFTDPKATQTFWQALNEPLVSLPEAPKDLPNLPQMGPANPALAGAVWNGIKPLLEGVETPLGVATIGLGSGLKAASAEYPLAKAALVGMEGVFAGLMGYGATKAAVHSVGVLKDPEATFQEKATAVTETVADAAAAAIGTLGVAIELFPKAKGVKIVESPGGSLVDETGKKLDHAANGSTVTQESVVKELQGKNPAQAAEILKEHAAETDAPGHSDFLMDAAHHLEEIATEQQKRDAKVDIGKRDEKVSTGTGVATDFEEKMMADWKKQIAEETKGTVAVGVKNATVDSELKRMGMTEAEHGASTTDKAELAKAGEILANDAFAGQKLVAELNEKPRVIDATEVAVLTREAVRLRLERRLAEEEFLSADTLGDQAERMDARQKIDRISDEYAKTLKASTLAGTSQAQAFRARQMMLKEDYSLAEIERRQAVAKGQELTPQERSEIRDLSKRLDEAQAKIEAYDKMQREREAAPLKQAPKMKPPTGKARQFIADQASQARERIKARLSEGRVSSGLDPVDLADHAIIGAEYIAKGLDKFKDWSAAMVNEFGERIRPYLDDIFKKSVEARKDAQKLQAYKTRTETATEKLRGKLAAGDLSKTPARKLQLDPEAVKLKAEYERVKREIDLKRQEAEHNSRSLGERAKDFTLAVNRAGVLSRVAIIAKLSAVVAGRILIQPIREGIKLGVTKVAPGIAKRARFEAVDSFGGYIRAEARALTAILTKGLPGAWDNLRVKDTDLQAVLEKEHLPPGVLEYPTWIHKALHYPVQVSEYTRRLSHINERDLRAGIDMKEPVNQLHNMQEAWEYSKRSIFLQDNKLVEGYKTALNRWSSKDKSGQLSPLAKTLAFGLQMENPVLKIPANIASELGEHLFGLFDAPARFAMEKVGLTKDKAFAGLTQAEADTILRRMSSGLLGGALVLLGFYHYKNVGGFYEKGERRKTGEPQPGDIKAGGVTIPHMLLHDISWQALNAGATLHRTLDSTYRLHDSEKKDIPDALLAVSLGIADATPFVDDAEFVAKLMDPKQRSQALAQHVAQKLVPGLVQEMAAYGDKQHPLDLTEHAQTRKITEHSFGGALKQNLMKEIPGLREKLPKGPSANH